MEKNVSLRILNRMSYLREQFSSELLAIRSAREITRKDKVANERLVKRFYRLNALFYHEMDLPFPARKKI